MSKNNGTKHTPRKPRPSELAAKAARAAKTKSARLKSAPNLGKGLVKAVDDGFEKLTKRGPGRPPEESTAFDKTTMVRMFQADYAAFRAEAKKLAAKSGSAVSVGAYLRMAGRAMIGAA